MTSQWRLSVVFFIVESFAAARPAFGMIAPGIDTQVDILPTLDATPSLTNNIADARGDSSTLAPYAGVARRKPAFGSEAFCYPASVLRPKL